MQRSGHFRNTGFKQRSSTYFDCSARALYVVLRPADRVRHAGRDLLPPQQWFRCVRHVRDLYCIGCAHRVTDQKHLVAAYGVGTARYRLAGVPVASASIGTIRHVDASQRVPAHSRRDHRCDGHRRVAAAVDSRRRRPQLG